MIRIGILGLVAFAGLPMAWGQASVPASVRSTGLEAVLDLTVRRGESREDVALKSDHPLALSMEEGGAYTAQGGNLEVRGKIIPGTGGRLSHWDAEFHNTGHEQQRLELVLQWRVNDLSAGAIYWDGSVDVQPVAQLSDSENFDAIRYMMPLAALGDRGRAVVAGLHYLDLRSYIGSRWERVKNAEAAKTPTNSATVGFVTRIVLEPGQTVPVRFLFGEFPVEYGLQNEVAQRLHDTVPEAFHPNPKADPSLYGASAQYWASRLPPEETPASAVLEMLRRYQATWDWSYAPFKRTGDLWGHEDLWDYTPNIPFEKMQSSIVQSKFHFSDVTREQFLAMRERHFNHDRGRDGLYFFTPGGVWVEKQLANERYPDALTVDKNYKYELTQWVSGHDREVKVLPWFTSYEPVLKADWKRIVATYDICGVALDVCRGGPRYRGPSIKKPLAVRAWDEQGVYIDQGTAIAKYIDFLHTLHVRQSPEYVLAVRGNPETGGATYMTAARYDGSMFEGPPYHPNHRSLILQRYLHGQKPLTWWSGWMYSRYAVPNFRNYDTAHFIKTMQGLADYVILASFEFGGVPTLNYEHGVPAIGEILPDLIDALHLGWQAVFPVRFEFEGKLHTARYGQGLNTLLFYGNPNDDDRPFQVAIDNPRLGTNGNLIFAPWRGEARELTNALKGRETRIAFALTARQPILHRVVAEMRNPRDLSVTTRARRDLYQTMVTLDFRETGEEAVELSLPELRDRDLVQVRVQGKPVELSREDGQVVLPALTPVDGRLTLEIEYRSPWLHLTREEVKAFPLLDDNGTAAFGIVTEGSKEATEMAAEKLRQYPAFYAAAVLKKEPPVVKIQQKDSSGKSEEKTSEPKGRRIVLKVDPKAKETGAWLTDPHLLLVQGRSARELENALDHLLAAFDEFYPFTPGFKATWGMGADVLNHTRMEGKVLPAWKKPTKPTTKTNEKIKR